MKGGLISYILILSFVSQCLCLKRLNFGLEIQKSTYNVLDYGAKGDGKSDDEKAFLSAWNETCNAEGETNLVVPKGKVFKLSNLELKGPCKAKNIHIKILGEIVAADMDQWGPNKLHLITISNVSSLKIDGGGRIDGNGKTWWERCKDCQRPSILYFYGVKDVNVSSLHVSNSPGFHIPINGSENIRFSNMNVTAPGNSHNTDAFDLWDTKNVVFEDSITSVGDDCIAIKAGCSYINVTRFTCGPGHGISIGSLGVDQMYETVEEVHVKNCTFIGTTNGARIKTWENAPGFGRKITFEDIIVINAQNPIIIDQHYGTKTPHKDAVSMPVSDVIFRRFKGTVYKQKAINLNCSSNGCFNITLEDINLVSNDTKKKAQGFATNAHGRVHNVIPQVSLQN